jgi:ABC-type dipeptide/oligopeptide/nickel transport system permease component
MTKAAPFQRGGFSLISVFLGGLILMFGIPSLKPGFPAQNMLSDMDHGISPPLLIIGKARQTEAHLANSPAR